MNADATTKQAGAVMFCEKLLPLWSALCLASSVALVAFPRCASAQPRPETGTGIRDAQVQRELDALVFLSKAAEASTTPTEKENKFRLFLDAGTRFAREFPEVEQIWLMRAAAAVEMNLPQTGWEAGQRILEKRIAWESRSNNSRELLTALNLKGWLNTSPPLPSPEDPWVNSLGMKFVRVGRVLFCLWETRVQDFEEFIKNSKYNAGGAWRNCGQRAGPTHPVVELNWEDAQAFCKWLTEKEQKAGVLPLQRAYRLPTKEEWNVAIGIQADDHDDTSVQNNTGPNHENISGTWLSGRHDEYPQTAPVGSFSPNPKGLFDVGGNVWEWGEDLVGPRGQDRTLRGSSFKKAISNPQMEIRHSPRVRANDHGFRVVITLPPEDLPGFASPTIASHHGTLDSDAFMRRVSPPERSAPPAARLKEETDPSLKAPAQIIRNTRDSSAWQPGGNRKAWVLSVGVGQYKNPAIPALPFAKADAVHIRDWFLQPEFQTLSRENVHVLFDEQASRENFLAQIDWLRKQAMPEDAVIIYFAGHGAPELAADGKSVDAKYLLLYDTDPAQLFATGFSLDDLTRKLGVVKAQVQVVILEACYTGPVGQDILQRTPTADLEIRPRFIQEMGERSGRVILSASSGRQIAIGSDEIKGGLFTHHLLNAWSDGSRRLLSDCFENAREQVRRAANRLGSAQEPTKFGDQNIDLIFLDK